MKGCYQTFAQYCTWLSLCSNSCHLPSVFQQGEWCEPITLRPPNEATSSTPVQYWQHHPEKLIFQSCDYEAYVSACVLCLHSHEIGRASRRGRVALLVSIMVVRVI